MCRILIVLALSAAALLGQYKMETAGAPPSELPAEMAQVLQKEGFKILSDSGSVLCELWLRSSMPSGPKLNEESLTLNTVPHGALLGVIRYVSPGADRRGQTLKPGIYTLRFSFYPVDGSHQGAAPQRDFLILSPAAEDKDPNATPGFEPLMNWSRKAAGAPHPACLSLWKADTDFAPGFAKMGEHDWVLQTKLGDTPVAIILIGVAEG